MKNLTLVKTPGREGRRHWIVFNVTPRRRKQGLNADRVGPHLFAGYWYGKGRGHRTLESYGKIAPVPKNVKIIGRAGNSYLVRRLLR